MRRPHISTNLAISADGKISSTRRIPAGWTSKEDHQRLLDLRQDADALLVGRGTLESDRMTMLAPGKTTQPLRCVVSRSGKFNPDHPLFHKPGGDIHLLATGPHPAPDQHQFPAHVTFHHQSLPAFLESLAAMGIATLHCEGGGELIHELAEIDAIDEFHVTLAGHTLFGGLNAPTPSGIPAPSEMGSRGFRLQHFEPLPGKGECFASYLRDKTAAQ